METHTTDIYEEDITNDPDLDDVDDLDHDDTDGDPATQEQELYEHHHFCADRGQAPMRIDKFLMEHMNGTSRNRLQQAAEAGFIHVNGKPVKSSYKVKPLDDIVLFLNRPKYNHRIIAEDIALNVVYEDADVMVVNKGAGMVVHPGCGNYTGTLVNAIAWHLKNNPTYDPDDPSMGLVHRIDKDTSGLLVVAKNADAKTCLGRQFYHKTTQRVYHAVVWGSFDNEQGRIEGNIARHPKDRMQMAVFPPDSGIGKHAVTHYRVLENWGYVSLVECRLETGRTHQIRAHMKHIGHPLFNDARYGGHEIIRGTPSSKYKQFVRHCFEACPRQALHARTLGFVHPRTGEQMHFCTETPSDMALLITRWRSFTTARQDIE